MIKIWKSSAAECSFESVQETAATMNGEAVSYIFKYKEKEETDERL